MSNDWAKETYHKCAWCGKQFTGAGRFCSERCKVAYDRAHGTVDGGYQEGSFGHKLHNFFKIIEYIISGIIILGIIIALFSK